MTFDCSCFQDECWRDYLLNCCNCCCDCNWNLTFSFNEACGVGGGTIHYTVDGGSEQTTTSNVTLEYEEGHTICSWFEPDDPSEGASSTLECVNDPCGSCTHSAATCVEYITDTISFGTTCGGGNCICDSANGFLTGPHVFQVGMILCVDGSSDPNNNNSISYPNGHCRIASVAAGQICLELTDTFGGANCQNAFAAEAAGATITLTGIIPDECTTYVCFEGCGQIPDDADLDLYLTLDLSGTCYDNCNDGVCDCLDLISLQVGTCDGLSCIVGSEELFEIEDICFGQINANFFGIDPILIQSSFCVKMVTQWCGCDSGCTLDFDYSGSPIYLEYTGGDDGDGAFFIRFLPTGDPPCEITYCIDETCQTLNYDDTLDLIFISEDEMNPTCIEVSCGGEAIETPLFLKMQNNKILVNKNKYAKRIRANKKLNMLKYNLRARKLKDIAKKRIEKRINEN